jgi:hypothetical protein
MKLGTTKPCPRITVWRTVKCAGNGWTQTARTFGTTNSSRCQTVRVFERDRALTSTIVGRQPSPRSNPHEASTVEGFERPGRSLYGLRRASRITDINSLLQALEWVPVRAEQSLEEANVVCGHDTPPVPQHTGGRGARQVRQCGGAAGRPPPVIREKSQFRAQHDSLSLSPAHDGTSLYLNFRALAALSFGRPIFRRQRSRARE